MVDVATKAKIRSIEMVIVPDEDGDASYLEQDGFADRLDEYKRGDFGFVGIQARATIEISYGKGSLLETIASPGLWSIEDDSGDEYFKNVYQDELLILRDMLAGLNVETEHTAYTDTDSSDWFLA